MKRSYISAPHQKSRSYSPAVITEGGRIVWLAGHLAPEDLDGNSLEGDFAAQVRCTFAKLEKTLDQAGGSLADIVTMTVFITDVGNNTSFVELRKEFFGDDYPASTLVTVAALNRPEMMVEIQAVAVVGDQESGDDKLKRAQNYLNLMLYHDEAYHSQKEKMGHAAFLFIAAIFGSVLVTTPWLLAWISEQPVFYWMIFAAVTFAWLTAHSFMRWQLRLRRAAAINFAADQKLLSRWITNPPQNSELELYRAPKNEEEPGRKRNLAKYFGWIDYLIVLPKSQPRSDIGDTDQPQCLVEEKINQWNEGTGATKGESFPTYGSIAMYAAILIRTILEICVI